MKAIHRVTKLALGTTAGLALMLTSTTPAAASTWELRDLEQRMCVTSSFGHPNTYFVALVLGRWSRPIETGLRSLPPGVTSLGGSTIPPGSNYPDPNTGGSTINSFIHISIPPLPVGVYTPEVYASDGRQTQSNRITINVKTACP